MNDKCEKAESGRHEPDFEHLEYETHVNARTARFASQCLHCGARCETIIDIADFDWID